MCAFVPQENGARVTVVGRHDKKLELVRKAGIHGIQLSGCRPQLADLVVEATGSSTGLKLAIETVRPRATLVLKSTLAEEHALSLAPLVINEVTVVGSRCGPFPPALQALSHKHVPVSSLIEAAYPLAEGIQAVNHAARRGALKVLLRNTY